MSSLNAKKILKDCGIIIPPIDPIYIAQKLSFKLFLADQDVFYSNTKEIYLNKNNRKTKQNFICATFIYHLLNNNNFNELNVIKTQCATLFAVELLMPDTWVRAQLYVTPVTDLYKIFNVTPEVMQLRLKMIYPYI